MFLLLLLLIPTVCSEIEFENLLVTASPQYFKKINVTKYPNGTIDLYGELVKVMEGQIFIKSTYFQILANNRTQKFFEIPKVNYCHIRRSLSTIPVLSDLVVHIRQYGNWTSPCPWKKGVYTLTNMPMDKHFLPMPHLLQKGRYSIMNTMTDENKMIKRIINFNFVMSVN